ncbi:retrovirus-related pol polyprotein line-1 [Plakobranchus ocellatus]|uniref:pyridoxal 5'-phosphate synthase n=1 Tax=Plakobranchus ocellatus TaxID=259542 RepID=A0AAV3YJ83_9GAST|nr:retrovirus-related pol polyprotein line-1 [Plakobranchus ocellatus]
MAALQSFLKLGLNKSRAYKQLHQHLRHFCFAASGTGNGDRSQTFQGSSQISHGHKEIAAGMRKPYKDNNEVFDIGDLVSKEPFKQFLSWFDQARKTDDIKEANAMALATATKDGIPSVRMVLMKGIDDSAIYFYTNYLSQKAKELDENPHCSLMFYWELLNKSVRISGVAQRVSKEESTDYFHSRPKASQIGACVSLQSSVVKDRKVLDERNQELTEKYSDSTSIIPKPDFWGGYKVIPTRFEFWQGQTNRLHDRIVFRKPLSGETINPETTHRGSDGWVFERLMP